MIRINNMLKNMENSFSQAVIGPKYLPIIMLSFSMIIAISNWYDSRLVLLFGLTISPGSLSYPFSFTLSDIITEVYGYKNARQAILAALVFNVFFLLYGQTIIHLPCPPESISKNIAFNEILSSTTMIILGSFVSYFISEPLNSYTLAKLKIKMKGAYTGIRFLASSIISSCTDSFIFIFIAFYNVMPLKELAFTAINVWMIKSLVEILGLPLSTRLSSWLKNREKIDIYDIDTNFNPFLLDTSYKPSNNFFRSL